MLIKDSTKLRNEIRMLICLSRKTLAEPDLKLAQQLIEDPNLFDWDYCLAAAVFHGVFPIFFKHVKLHFAAAVPAKTFKIMSVHNEKICHQNLALVGTFLQYYKLLEKNKIRSVMFKGPSTALHLYQDVLLREFSDVDVLVALEDVRAAEDLLLASGYQPMPERDPPLKKEFFQSDLFFSLESEHTFAKERPTGVIDLHWQVQPSHLLPLSFEKVWGHTQPQQVEGKAVQTIEPNLSLVLLTAHATKHCWKRLLWLVDIAEMMDNQARLQLDWARVERLSGELSVTPMVVLAMSLAERIFQVPAPAFVHERMTDSLQTLSDQVVSNLDVLSEEAAGLRFMGWKFCATLISSWPGKTRYLIREAFYPSIADYLRLKLPAEMFGAYFLLRPFWLVKDTLSRRLAGVAGNPTAGALPLPK